MTTTEVINWDQFFNFDECSSSSDEVAPLPNNSNNLNAPLYGGHDNNIQNNGNYNKQHVDDLIEESLHRQGSSSSAGSSDTIDPGCLLFTNEKKPNLLNQELSTGKVLPDYEALSYPEVIQRIMEEPKEVSVDQMASMLIYYNSHLSEDGKDEKIDQLNKVEDDYFQILNKEVVSFKYVDKEQVNCLDCTKIDYNNYTGELLHSSTLSEEVIHKVINTSKLKFIKPAEYIYDEGDLASISGVNTRTRYERLIETIKFSITNIVYVHNKEFSKSRPYEPQYIRFEIKDNHLRKGSGSGLCPYCEKVRFLPFKNSSYLSHLTLEHGVYSTNYLVPEPVAYGKYYLADVHSGRRRKKAPKTSKYNTKKAFACPCCAKLCEAGIWSTKENPLLKYYRHFKEHHNGIASNVKQTVNQFPPLRKRGRKLNGYTDEEEARYLASAIKRRRRQ